MGNCVFFKEISVRDVFFRSVEKIDLNDEDGRWDLENPMIKAIEDDSLKANVQRENEENLDPISVLTSVDGQIWCAIHGRIFVISPDSFHVQVKSQISLSEYSFAGTMSVLAFICR